jgi:hypothetical protein
VQNNGIIVENTYSSCLDESWISPLSDQNPLDFWKALSHPGNQSLLAPFAKVVCSFPMSEAEDEKILSILKFIIRTEDRGRQTNS